MSRQHQISNVLRQFAAAALVAGLSLTAAPMLLPPTGTPALAQYNVAGAPVADNVRAVLSQYGNFIQHQTYGEVWVPSVTPQGWHPYPACHWVNSRQYGWYYDDKTPWGAIVHHYGRWTNDPQVGWFWVPGSEFSPGWVLWRTNLQWVGWAPMPPDEQIQNANPDQFNSADFWTFMETAKFDNNCTETSVVAGQPGLALIQQTTFVRDVNIVNGILVYVLPTYVIGPFVDINIDFFPWPSWFFGQVLIDWNWIWNNVNVVINVNNVNCPPVAPNKLVKPINNPVPTPPPGPGGPSSGGGGGGGTLQRCPDGTLANAYGACPTPITNTCGPNMTPFGNFCLPISTPTCARGTTPVRTAGGGFQCLPIGVVTCLNGHLADGKCVQDPPPCGAGMMRIAGGGCGPIVVTQPNCGPFATNVGGRCTPIKTGTGGETSGGGGTIVGGTGGSNNPPGGPTGGIFPPRGTGDGSKGGGGTTTGGNTPPSGPDNNLCLKCGDCCILRHPPSPVGDTGSTGKTGNTGTSGIANTGGGSKDTGGHIPIHRIPSGVFTQSQPPSSSKPSYVLGRGGGGLNVFKGSGPTSTPSAGKTNFGNISSFRSSPAPILHAMPSMGGGGGMGGGSKGPMIR